jgi:TatD DNase family protein
MLIETHAHLYLEEFLEDIDGVIKNSVANGVGKIYLPAINSETHDALMDLEMKFPEVCFPMMGLHPCYVKEDYKKELILVEEWLSNRKFSAIGECGLDFYWDKTFVNQQYVALEQQIAWAIQYQLPIVLHTRNATQETIEVVKKYISSGLRGIFHCFGGTFHEAQQIIEMGFYLGIGGVVTYKNSGLDKVIADIDLRHLVLETDAPYLTPVPFRGKRNETGYLKIIAEKIANIKNCSFEEVAAQTTSNAIKIFG